MPSNARTSPDERDRAQRCLDLKLAGKSWVSIAAEMGYRDESGARKAAERLLDRVEAAQAAQYRALEGARLDAVQERYWRDAADGDIRAAELLLKIHAARVKLFGLAAPEKVSIEGVTWMSPDEAAAEVARLVAMYAEVARTGEDRSAAMLAEPWVLDGPLTAVTAESEAGR